MKRSDISNINKLFTESVSDDAYVIYSTSSEDDETLPTNGDTLEDATMDALAQYFDERPPELYETLRELTSGDIIWVDPITDISIIWMNTIMIVARPSKGITNSDIISYVKSHMKEGNAMHASDFAIKLEHKKRKAETLYGSNDEAGLGSVLDAL